MLTLAPPQQAPGKVNPDGGDAAIRASLPQEASPAGARVLYLAHDLDDPSIWRRVTMLERGGAQVAVAGFRRGEGPLHRRAEILGRTHNGRMGQRALAVLRAAPRMRRLAGTLPDVVIARNLEMLVLGALVARGRPRARLIYELLDIHGMMLGSGRVSRQLRRIEAALIRRSAAVIVSSPAFVSRYLTGQGVPAQRIRLVENKPLVQDTDDVPRAAPRLVPAEAGRLTIGWFGMLRCRWSLQTLDALTRAAPGRFRVVLRGRPALDVIPDFHQVVEANPDLSFGGPYQWPGDLARIYGAVDFAWMIDRYQAGQNSAWLLPNRLYEGGLHGAIPIALAGTEVASRLAGLEIGVVAASPEEVSGRVAAIGPDDVPALRAAVAAIPRRVWVADDDDCRQLVAALKGADTGRAE